MLKIYNTQSQQKEAFKPITEGEIKLYVCGITVYDYCHLGHARVFVAFDAIVRFLRASGWKVTYVRNITDIDDKIIHRANELGEHYTELTGRFIEAMHEDEARLGVLRPDQEPRATDHIDQIIDLCQRLESKGASYVGDNKDLFFSVESFDSYGALAHKDLENLQSGVRVDVVDAKRNPLDFVLWKQSKENEPHWESPWGGGRPGWHIECSAMSTHCLGNHFDIHGGGQDLTFPHHENERAQSEAAFDEKFVNTWMHVGFVQVNKEKMSKSLGNFFTIRDILEQYEGEVVRYFLLSSQYRSPVNYATDLLDNAKSALTTLYNALRGVDVEPMDLSKVQDYEQGKLFFDVMNDDFNTPKALSVLFDLAHAINTKKQAGESVEDLASLLKALGGILGVLESNPEQFLQGDELDFDIDALIVQRNEARANKQWAKSDEIRDTLLEKGIVLEDTSEGTIWRRQ